MITFNTVMFYFLFLLLLVISSLAFIDNYTKRKLTKRPKVSFMIPCYNDGNTVERTIKSLYDSYDNDKIELIIANDKSTDNSLEILKKLQKTYGFKLINNAKNIGKSRTLNNISKLAKHEILWVVDADIILNKKAVEDVLARFEKDLRVAAVSCPYSYADGTFFERMQSMECNLMSLLQSSQNIHTCFSLWGGCLAVRKSAFEKVGRFSVDMHTEDIELSFKLAEHKFKVQQSLCNIMTFPVDSFSGWYRQKVRWAQGATQCYFKHWKVWIKHPLQVFFLAIFTIINLISVVYLFKEIILLKGVWTSWRLIYEGTTLLISLKAIGILYGLQFVHGLLIKIYFSAFSLPYTYTFFKKPWKIWNALYAIPFSLLYLPAFTLIFLWSIPKGIKSFLTLKKGQRSW